MSEQTTEWRQRALYAEQMMTIHKHNADKWEARWQALAEAAPEALDRIAPAPLIEGHPTDCRCEQCGQEWLKANYEQDDATEEPANLTRERDEARALARWYGQRLNEQGGMPRREFEDAKFRYPWLEFPGWLEERRG